ncbi:unknown protein [Microcystis aeruginosa NIES-843]|uniref:Uncharacterized protein n=1 Tax=Microcystis aeruginosa (strain NIES-843 / IAM M-2473) TaxID=449447 RepID=B0JP71_MICAN|nr:unknown protein [Microcystis aeruginosa NIES-843]
MGIAVRFTAVRMSTALTVGDSLILILVLCRPIVGNQNRLLSIVIISFIHQ